MSEPDYVERYQLDELESRVGLLEALHAGGLAVVEQRNAMYALLRQLSRFLGSKDTRTCWFKGDWKHTKKQIDELLASIDGR